MLLLADCSVLQSNLLGGSEMQRTLESDIYTGRFDDGLLDLCVGIGLLGVGMSWLSGRFVYGSLMVPLLLPVWMGLRKRITEPRMGRVEFSTARRASERAFLVSMFGLGCLILAIVVLVYVQSRSDPAEMARQLVPMAPGVLLGVGLALTSAVTGARRFVAYGIALALVAAETTLWLGWHPGAYLTLVGGLLTAWALGLLARFLAAHPNLESD